MNDDQWIPPDATPIRGDAENGFELCVRNADGLFHIGQVYDAETAATLTCRTCGGNQFHVGQGDFFTAIKCTTCLWEACIHTG